MDIEQVTLVAGLAEHQNDIDEAVDAATIRYLHAQQQLADSLAQLRELIDLRDSMVKVREYVKRGGVKWA